MKRKKTHKVVIFHLFDIHTAISITNLFKQKLGQSIYIWIYDSLSYFHIETRYVQIETKTNSTIITIMIMIPVFKLEVFVDLGLVSVSTLGSCDGLELG